MISLFAQYIYKYLNNKKNLVRHQIWKEEKTSDSNKIKQDKHKNLKQSIIVTKKRMK
jgi:hypothetical protein